MAGTSTMKISTSPVLSVCVPLGVVVAAASSVILLALLATPFFAQKSLQEWPLTPKYRHFDLYASHSSALLGLLYPLCFLPQCPQYVLAPFAYCVATLLGCSHSGLCLCSGMVTDILVIYAEIFGYSIVSP